MRALVTALLACAILATAAAPSALAAPHRGRCLPGSTVDPGETMVVDVQGNPRNDTRLHRYYGFDRPMLADSGERVRLQTYNDIVVACAAWARGRC
jgi:hypothetical protein